MFRAPDTCVDREDLAVTQHSPSWELHICSPWTILASSSCLSSYCDFCQWCRVTWHINQINPLLPKLLWSKCLVTAREPMTPLFLLLWDQTYGILSLMFSRPVFHLNVCRWGKIKKTHLVDLLTMFILVTFFFYALICNKKYSYWKYENTEKLNYV